MDTDLNKNVMALLSENEKIVFLKTLLRLSARDGHIDEAEIKHIKKTAQRYKVEDVKKIFENAGYTHIETIKDLNKNDRVIIFKK